LLAFARGRGAKLQARPSAEGRQAIKQLIKARMAKYLFDQEGFYTVLNQDDAMVIEALKALENPKAFIANKK
jgi:carboxyl-terminal processing protease